MESNDKAFLIGILASGEGRRFKKDNKNFVEYCTEGSLNFFTATNYHLNWILKNIKKDKLRLRTKHIDQQKTVTFTFIFCSALFLTTMSIFIIEFKSNQRA